MPFVLVTGASGFVGGAVVHRLASEGVAVRAAVRNPGYQAPAGAERAIVGDLGAATDWSAALTGVSVVVHASARVHVMQDRAADPLAEFRRVNVAGTMALAAAAAAAGVTRFVFISSIKVNGEATAPGMPYTSAMAPAPVDPYGISKLEAETALLDFCRGSKMEAVIIRPVLVYGPGVKGNFASMMRWIDRGLPLPLGAIHNRRSLVSIGNLTDLIVTCVDHPAAAGRTFLVSDGEDLSTTELLRRTAAALGRPARLVPVPAALIELAARAAGKGDIAQRLCGSLQVDIQATRDTLSWSPPVAVSAALADTARAYLAK